jgi:molybdopterin converting factor small subunit
MLKPSVGTTTLKLSGVTLADALEDGCTRVPALRMHLFQSKNRFRQHVLCFHNDDNVGERALDTPLSDGDTITIVQAISGG